MRYDSSVDSSLDSSVNSPVPTYHVENFGCRATQADGAALERQFESRGLARAAAAEADLVILNTCTVTNSADQDARAAIRRVQRQNPLAKIIVTGCYAQRAPAEIAALPGVTAVIGNSHKHQLAEIALRNVVTRPDWYKHDPHARNQEGQDQERQAREEHDPKGHDPKGRDRERHDRDAKDREGHDFSRAIKAAPRPALAAEVDSQNSRRTFLPVSTLTDNRERNTENSIYVSDIFAHTELLAAPVFESGIHAADR